MKKVIDWESKFNIFIDKNKNKSFAWGSWDCCKFANALIKVMTDEDLIPKKLKWKDEKPASAAIVVVLTPNKKAPVKPTPLAKAPPSKAAAPVVTAHTTTKAFTALFTALAIYSPNS